MLPKTQFLPLVLAISSAALPAQTPLLPPPVTGDVLLSSSGNDRLLRLTHDGRRVNEIALPGLMHPRGIAVAKDGSVFVASQNSNEVLVLDRALSFVRRFPTSSHATMPTGAAIGPNGNLFVAGFFSNTVGEFRPDGTGVRSYVGHGVSGPNCVALLSDGSFFVTSGGSGQVQYFDTMGNLSRAFTGFGLSSPMGAAIWNGELFVTGGSSDNIVVFDLLGNPRRQIRHAELSGPQGIAFSSDGKLVVSSFYTNKVSWFRPDGTHLFTVLPTGSTVPRSLAFLPGATIESTGAPRLGVPFGFRVVSPHDPGDVYASPLALSSSPGITLPDGRVLALAPDLLLVLSLQGIPWFSNLVGFLDGSGTASPTLSLPVDPILVGLRIYAAAVTIDPVYPTGIAQVSPTVSWVLGG